MIGCLILIVIMVIILMTIYLSVNIPKDSEIFTVSKGHYLLKTVTALLRKHKIKTWMDAGTLLGVIRDGELISNDTDVDISTYYTNQSKLSEIADDVQLLKTINLQCWRNQKDMVSFNVIGDRNSYIDVYLMKWKPKFVTKKFKNYVYNIPKDPETYLEILYGDWKVPRPGKHASPTVHLKGKGVKDHKKYFDENIVCWEAGHPSENKYCLDDL